MTNGHIGKKFLDHPDFEPVLARAEHLPRAADLQVDLRQLEAVALLRDRLEARQRRVAEEDADALVLAAGQLLEDALGHTARPREEPEHPERGA